jgi:uncharacterized membrane protein
LRNEEGTLYGFDPRLLRRICASLGLVLLYLSGAMELVYQFNTRYPEILLSIHYLELYTGLFVLVIWWQVRSERLRLSRVLCMIVMIGFLLFYLAAAPFAYRTQAAMLHTDQYGMHFIVHWMSAIVNAVVFYQLLAELRRRTATAEYRSPITWIVAAFAVVLVSVELSLLSNAIMYSPQHSLAEISDTYSRVGLPIIWGLCSFALMWLGMRHKYRPLRIVSLTLFTITLLKLFLFDIRGLAPGGKIAAFFSLGVLLLIVSFMYQRLRRLIIEDERKNDAAQ